MNSRTSQATFHRGGVPAVAVVIAALIAPALAGAALVPVSRDSTIRVTGQTAGDASYDRSEASTDPFETFTRELRETAVSGESEAESFATQSSGVRLGPADGTLSAIFGEGGGTARVSEFGGRAASSESTFLYRFRVDEDPIPFQFQASVTAGGTGRGHVRLVNDDTSVVIAEVELEEGEGDVESVLEEGMLSPGRYTLDARAFVSGTPFSGEEANFRANFVAIPLPPGVVPGAAMLLCLVGGHCVHRKFLRRRG